MTALRTALALALLAAAATPAIARPHAAPALAVRAHWSLPGEGHWDLLDVDSAAHRLYLSRGDRVQVVNTDTGTLVGEIPGTDGVHGIAIVPSLHRGFATDGRSNRVTEFDTATLKPVREIPVSGQSPDAVLFDAATSRLFVFNARSNNASVVDPVDGRELGTIAFDGNPELAPSDGAGHVYVNLESRGAVVDIDARTMTIAHTWAMDGCEEPTGLALDAAHHRLFSACANRVMAVTDARDGHAVARVPIGDGPDGLVFDAARGLALVPGGRDGRLTVVREVTPDRYAVVQTLATRTSARTIALDAATHRAYLPAAQFGPIRPGDKPRPPMLPGTFEVVVVGAR